MDEMLRACLAVGSVLNTVRADAPEAAFVAQLAQLDQAYAAVRDLPAGLCASALRCVLDEIDHCRRTGEAPSERLDSAIQIAVTALTLQTATERG